MSEPDPLPDTQAQPAQDPPHTGNPLVDRALADVADLDQADPAGHHDRLATAHERLHLALDPDAPLPDEIPSEEVPSEEVQSEEVQSEEIQSDESAPDDSPFDDASPAPDPD